MITLATRTVPLTVRLRLLSTGSGRPMPGYAVRLWQCEPEDGPGGARETADPAGWVSFPGAFPDAGTGRWPHVHFEVFARGGARLHAAQLALPGDACAEAVGRHHLSGQTLGDDECFAEGWTLEIPSVTGDARRGLVATRTVGV